MAHKFDPLDRASGEYALFQAVSKALFDRREVVWREVVADDVLLENVLSGAVFVGFYVAGQAGVQARAARLFLEDVLEVSALGDRLPVVDLLLTSPCQECYAVHALGRAPQLPPLPASSWG